MHVAVLVFTDSGSIIEFISAMTILWGSTRNEKKAENDNGDKSFHNITIFHSRDSEIACVKNQSTVFLSDESGLHSFGSQHITNPNGTTNDSA